jgi:hypothetical protein
MARLLWLTAIAVALAGCGGASSSSPQRDAAATDAERSDAEPGDAEPTEVDPGKPASEFGPRCWVELIDDASNTKIVFEDCTASAASMDRVSHVYLHFGRFPAEAKRLYVSLVLGVTPLAPGAHASARAGAVEATLSDGHELSVGDVKKNGSLELSIDQAHPAMNLPNVFYLEGRLVATLTNVQNASSSLRLRASIGTPITR